MVSWWFSIHLTCPMPDSVDASSVALPWWRQRRTGLIVLVLLVGLCLVWWRIKPQTADVVSVRTQALVRTLQFTGRVKTPARVEVGSTITGRVSQVLVHEGDALKAGAPLIQLESSEWRASVLQAQAALSQAQARLTSQQALALPNAQAVLAQADATLLAAERDQARVKELVASQFYSQSKLDDARRSVDVARAQRDAAVAQVQANRQRGGEGSAAVAQVDAARAALAVAQAKLDQATVRAPGAGRVLVRNVEPGQIVQAGHGLLTLSVDGPLELVAQVDERFLAQLQVGQRARVLADAYPDAPFDARLDRLAPSVDAQSGAVEVTFVVDGSKPAFLREDMTLSVEVITGQRAATRVLPLRALRGPATLARADQGEVLVLEGGRAVARSIKMGLRTLEQVEVVSGLNDTDQVVLDAAVVAGARVRPHAVKPDAGR
jgi:HlyD family secretion protein